MSQQNSIISEEIHHYSIKNMSNGAIKKVDPSNMNRLKVRCMKRVIITNAFFLTLKNPRTTAIVNSDRDP